METPAPDFVHLHLHTQYSLLDGAIRLAPLFKRAKEYGMHSVAITDHGTMFGVLDFFLTAEKAGIHPIVGCEAYVAKGSLLDKRPDEARDLAHLVLLAKNNEGYRNLCRLATIAQTKGFYYKPRIDDDVLAEHSEGLIALSACLKGSIPQLLLRGDLGGAEEKARFYEKIFGEGNFYLEVQENGLLPQRQVNTLLLDLSKKLSIPLVATNDCHYLDAEDTRAHEILLCIQTGKTMDDPNRFHFETDALYFKSGKVVEEELGHYPGALSNTVEIAKRCDVTFDLKTYHFPRFPTEEDGSDSELFARKSREGFEKRLKQVERRNPGFSRELYEERLEYEIEMINQMGFPGYFLIVSDFIRYSREIGVPVGPGRGSAAGSMVAYAMGITDLDPIENGLIFERFLNPARISMPDIDVDFCINGREKVYEYVSRKYGGGAYVAQIITFGKLKARAVIRDVGRALGIPLRDVDSIAKLVPDTLNISLQEALEREPELQHRTDERPDIRELIEIALKLEGLPRHASTHAAGVVIGDTRLDEYLPLYSGKKGEIVTQFDMNCVEKIGLVKFDFLGLRNLTVIQNALDIIRGQGLEPPEMEHLPLDDAATYALLSEGDTIGVFQLESSGMKDLVVRMQPSSFGDITALVALYRPGPLESGMVDDFVDCKHGRKDPNYLVPALEPILESTYGVILYQEQVMQIASRLGGFSMSDADELRKAMGKKLVEKMGPLRERFLEGAARNNHPKDKMKELFGLMEKFGGYGFNKSHSAAYALLAYETAYLKAHYPLAFMAALLNSELHSLDGVVKFVKECGRRGIQVLGPDVNSSGLHFTVVEDAIRFGLAAVKNVGEGPVMAIVEERKENGPFIDLLDFCERMDLSKVNRRVLEALIKAGAFDSTGTVRSRLMASLEDAMEHGSHVQKEKNNPQMGLFDIMDDPASDIPRPRFPEIPEWNERDKLLMEKEFLGFYLSGNPLAGYEETFKSFLASDVTGLKDLESGKAVRVGGSVHSAKIIFTKKGEKMAFVTLEDTMGASLELIIFPSLYAEVAALLHEDTPVIAEGELQVDESSLKIKVEKLAHAERASEVWSGMLHLVARTDIHGKHDLLRVQEILRTHPGTCPISLEIEIPEKTRTRIDIPDLLRVNIEKEMMEALYEVLGEKNVRLACTPPKLVQRSGNGQNGFWKKQTNGAASS